MRTVFLAICFFIAQSAFGCSCEENSVANKFAESDFVYVGQIKNARINEQGSVENALVPIEVFKGAPDQWLMLSEQGPVKECLTYAGVGLFYVVYGNQGEIPRLSLCSFTQPIGLAYEDEIGQLREAANK